MAKSIRRLGLLFLLILGLVLLSSLPAQAKYSATALKQCLWTKPADNPQNIQPELPTQINLHGRDYILVRYRSENGIQGYGVVEVAANKKCWNPSATPTFNVDPMLRRLPLRVGQGFAATLRKDQAEMYQDHLKSMRAAYPGVPDKTLLEWMDNDANRP